VNMYDNRAVDETEAMLRQYADTGDTYIRDRIVEKNLKIAAMVARRFSGKGVDYDDLYQVASLALFKAIDRYDPERGVKFVSFVTPTMVGEVKNYFRDRSRTIRLPRNSGEMTRALDKATEELSQMLLRQPTTQELADHMGLDLETVLLAIEMRGASRTVSLDFTPENEDEDAPMSAFLGMEEKGFANFEMQKVVGRLAPIAHIPLQKSKKNVLDLLAKEAIIIPIETGVQTELSTRVEIVPSLSAPLTEGEVCGRLLILEGDRILAQTELIAAESAKALDFGSYLGILYLRWVG